MLSYWILLLALYDCSAILDPGIISVEPGGDVTLPCEAPGRGTIIVVEWRRTDLKDRYVLLVRDKRLDPEGQLQSYRDRVDLTDLQMKNRDIGLILKNFTADDEGTYECRFIQRNSRRQQRSVIGGDPVCSFSLRVGPPGTPEKNQDGEKNTSEELRPSLYLVMVLVLLGLGFVSCSFVQPVRTSSSSNISTPNVFISFLKLNYH